MELLLIRHGRPQRVHNTDGTPADPPLDEEGLKQAELMAQRFSPGTIDRLFVSPMQRAQETAAPLARQLGLTAELREGVAEYDQHSAVYIPVEELRKMDPKDWPIPERNEAEMATFKRVVVENLEEIVAGNPGKRVAVVCHGGVINAWAAHTIELAKQFFFIPDYTSINKFMVSRNGERSLIALNDAVHIHGVQL
ncbi:MAG: histidine phosphatase family protein [Pseudomonadota bacterium]